MHIRRVVSRTPVIGPTYRYGKKVVRRVLHNSNSLAVTTASDSTVKKLIGGDYFFSHDGYCVCCDRRVVFTAHHRWLRDSYLCTRCQCKPRERALMVVVEKYYPNWKNLQIHEGSPMNRGASVKIRKHSKHYLPTQYFPDQQFGAMVQGFRNEDLEKQTFKDKSFDLVITLDVMEHVYDPKRVFQEVARTLKKGGAYIFTVPMINKHQKTQVWAKKGKDGKPVFLHVPEYHGNPVDASGSPVTMHWGYDIVDYIKRVSGMDATIVAQYDKEHGIMGEYNEVVVAVKK